MPTPRTLFLGAVAALALTACSGDEGNVFSIEVGECFNDPSSTTEVANVEIVDCDDPHDNEVVHIENVDGDDFPGEVALGTQAEEACRSGFEDYVGADFLQTRFGFSALTPSSQSWDAGDREIVCYAFADDGQRTEGSLEDAGPSEASIGTSGDTLPLTPGVPGSGGEAGDADQPPAIDDDELAQLADECFDGSGSSCDRLFFESPAGSDAEEYGNTCGGRFDASPGLCATAIGD